MIVRIADNITSPLGFDSGVNYRKVLEGESALRIYEDLFGLPEKVRASMFDREVMETVFEAEIPDSRDCSFFEKLCIYSASRAIADCGIDPSADDVIFILSTTKGNVEYLARDPMDPRCYLSHSARKIAEYFRNGNESIVVSNACISGVCAQITAVRELLSGNCRRAIVIGGDVLSKFIISGFQSFKALSEAPCRPYDKERTGLNLGEAIGTIILEYRDSCNDNSWCYLSSSIHNDANHISGPSRTGEGAYRVLSDILEDVEKEQLTFINAHGTSTLYNDEMESIALYRAGVNNIPLNGLKGVYGHTLGAAGIIETILSMKAVDNGIILPTAGYENRGTTYPLNISHQPRPVAGNCFIKILSGFGGSNAGIAYRKGGAL